MKRKNIIVNQPTDFQDSKLVMLNTQLCNQIMSVRSEVAAYQNSQPHKRINISRLTAPRCVRLANEAQRSISRQKAKMDQRISENSKRLAISTINDFSPFDQPVCQNWESSQFKSRAESMDQGSRLHFYTPDGFNQSINTPHRRLRHQTICKENRNMLTKMQTMLSTIDTQRNERDFRKHMKIRAMISHFDRQASTFKRRFSGYGYDACSHHGHGEAKFRVKKDPFPTVNLPSIEQLESILKSISRPTTKQSRMTRPFQQEVLVTADTPRNEMPMKYRDQNWMDQSSNTMCDLRLNVQQPQQTLKIEIIQHGSKNFLRSVLPKTTTDKLLLKHDLRAISQMVSIVNNNKIHISNVPSTVTTMFSGVTRQQSRARTALETTRDVFVE